MKNETELVQGLEEVDMYFIEKTYFPTFPIRVQLRNAIDYIKTTKAIRKGNTGIILPDSNDSKESNERNRIIMEILNSQKKYTDTTIVKNIIFNLLKSEQIRYELVNSFTDSNVSGAKFLGVSERTYYRKKQEYKLD